MKSFEGFDLSVDLLRHLKTTHYQQPTPIQEKAIPLVLTGGDVIGIAQTGTGKTAAFLLPIITRILAHKAKQAIIMAPTRELAVQITDVLDELGGKFEPIKAALLIGGASMGKQVQILSRNPSVIVATPGRLNDHIRRRTIQFKNPCIVVLDEMDRMLDMGFLPQIRSIFDNLSKERQTLLFSATFPKEIRKLAEQYTNNAQQIAIDAAPRASENVKQSHVEVAGTAKNDYVLDQIKTRQGPALIFTRTKIRADRLSKFLKKNGIRTTAIHGDRSQFQRQEAIQGFLEGRYDVLVATDIASRGLDIPSIRLVINFDLPMTKEDYIHRIGRTARGGDTGVALSIVTPEEQPHFKWLVSQKNSGEQHSNHAPRKPKAKTGRSFFRFGRKPGGKPAGRFSRSEGHSQGRFARAN